ncbi:MAG TPA: hypothetical protein ENI12_00825 [Nitrospirae bacterium]|nr:hypothetical protein [Nitrospirota bacterium]
MGIRVTIDMINEAPVDVIDLQAILIIQNVLETLEIQFDRIEIERTDEEGLTFGENLDLDEAWRTQREGLNKK